MASLKVGATVSARLADSGSARKLLAGVTLIRENNKRTGPGQEWPALPKKTTIFSGKPTAPVTGAGSSSPEGTAAAFKVELASEIIATLPTGATTGILQVVTLNGTLSSNVAFRVR